MLDYMVNDLKHSLETVWQWFLMSKTSHRFERGDCSVLSGMSGVELARMVLQESGQSTPVTVARNTGRAGLSPTINGTQGCISMKSNAQFISAIFVSCIHLIMKWISASL